MASRSMVFARYVDAARNGRTALWRVLLGIALIGALYMGWAAAVFLFVAFAGDPERFLSGGSADAAGFDRLLRSPLGIACILALFAAIWPGVWCACRLLHRRPLRSVLGADRRISRPALARGAAAGLCAAAVCEIGLIALDGWPERTTLALGVWLAWLPALVILTLVQTSAEELMFRGYLAQALAARFQSAWFWAGMPAIVFTLLHVQPVESGWMLVGVLAAIGAFALVATRLVYATGDLGASMGLHFGYNLFALLVVSNQPALGGAALFAGHLIDARSWTAGTALLAGALGIAQSLLALAALQHRRSPLRIRQVPEIAT
jgi:membrane protease YdiL (CAAX protease family)